MLLNEPPHMPSLYAVHRFRLSLPFVHWHPIATFLRIGAVQIRFSLASVRQYARMAEEGWSQVVAALGPIPGLQLLVHKIQHVHLVKRVRYGKRSHMVSRSTQ
jgi:hypothetical protein